MVRAGHSVDALRPARWADAAAPRTTSRGPKGYPLTVGVLHDFKVPNRGRLVRLAGLLQWARSATRLVHVLSISLMPSSNGSMSFSIFVGAHDGEHACRLLGG